MERADFSRNWKNIATGLLKLGATAYGGPAIIGIMQAELQEKRRWVAKERFIDQFHWLTPQEFIDGLALGQFTPGPILMVAAYVGYKVAGTAGAVVGAAAAFVPSVVLMLGLLPVFDRVRALAWMRAAMRGIGPAVIGVLAVSLLRLAPHALPDPFAVVLLGATMIGLLCWRIGTLKLMLAGSVLGALRNRWSSLHALKSALSANLGPRL